MLSFCDSCVINVIVAPFYLGYVFVLMQISSTSNMTIVALGNHNVQQGLDTIQFINIVKSSTILHQKSSEEMKKILLFHLLT